MGQEIERKFLLRDAGWRDAIEKSEEIRQGYLSRGVRVRRIGTRGLLTIKGPGGLVRAEFEYDIPLDDADAMLADLCSHPLIEKTRHTVQHAGRVWTVDEFHGQHAGLFLAEIELDRPDARISLPDWVGEEVTGNPRYQNATLAGLV